MKETGVTIENAQSEDDTVQRFTALDEDDLEGIVADATSKHMYTMTRRGVMCWNVDFSTKVQIYILRHCTMTDRGSKSLYNTATQ